MLRYGLIKAESVTGITVDAVTDSYSRTGGTATLVDLTTYTPDSTYRSFYELTTIFTPPTSCLKPTYYLTPSGVDVSNVWGAGNLERELAFTRGVRPECFPSYFPGEEIVYSPGVCPSGYQTVVSSVLDEVHYAICCPSGMEGSNTCYSTATEDIVVVRGSTITTLPGSTVNGTFVLLVATPVTVAYQSRDLSLLKSAPASVGPTAAATASMTTATLTASLTTTPISSISPTAMAGHTLTTGARAGIGIGVSLCALASAVVAVLLWRRKQDRSKSSPAVTDPRYAKAELEGEGKVVPELGGDGTLYEIHGARKLPEMDSTNVRAELDGGWRGWEAAEQREEEESRNVRHRCEGP